MNTKGDTIDFVHTLKTEKPCSKTTGPILRIEDFNPWYPTKQDTTRYHHLKHLDEMLLNFQHCN